MLLSLCFVVLIVFLISVLRVCFLWLVGLIPFALVDVMVQTFICAGIFASWFLLVGIISGYTQAAGAPSKREVVLRHQFLVPKPLFSALMSILGEVCISHLRCIQRHMQDDGQTEVFDISCRLTGNAGGQAPIRASIHVHTTTFDGEDWRLITLMCSHCARYETLFAPSCGSVGDFLDITQDVDGNLAIPADMRYYRLNVRRFTGEFYAHVYPFDTKLYRKAHTSGTLLFSGVHSHLILLQHLLISLPRARKPVVVFPDIPKYWLEEDGTLCPFADRRWRAQATLKWLHDHGLRSVPLSIREEIGDLIYGDSPPGL